MKADVTVTDVNTYGLAKARFLAVRPTYAEDFYKLEVDIELPKMLMEGNYKADGQMGSFQISGEGTSSRLISDRLSRRYEKTRKEFRREND